MAIDVRPTIAEPDDDPHLWLEEIDGIDALKWVEAQNARTLKRFGAGSFAADRDSLRSVYDQPDNIPYIARRGEHIFNFWTDANSPRGLWRRTSLRSFGTDNPDWEVILDIDALAKVEDEDWIWGGATTIPETHDRAILRLSRGGGDAVVLREFDILAKSFVDGGFHLPEAKGGVSWLDRDTVLLNSSIGDGMATDSGYPRTVRLWERGTDHASTPVIFEVDAEHVAVHGEIDRTVDVDQLWFVDIIGFFDAQFWIGNRTGATQALDIPTHVTIEVHRGWLVAKPREPWMVGGGTYVPDTLLGARLSDVLAGKETYQVLYEPDTRKALRRFFWVGGKLVLPILDNLKTRFEVLTPTDASWQRDTFVGLPEIGVVDVWRLDIEESESNGDLLVNTQDPVTPSTLSLLTEGRTPEVLKTSPRHFDTDGLVVTQHEATSVDGVAIPYTQVGPANGDGNAPVHMTGYGGFGLPMLPNYNPSIGKLWLERGGTSVVTHIRGGGEFGTAWHDAGRNAGKALSHDDFAAVAADLVARGVTNPERIAAEGGSNGGILITNMLTRYPARFGALFCTIPLIDMRRFAKLLAGASWIAEYGDPDKPEDWEFLKSYSAYHAAVPEKNYPPILLATARRDDRVHPGHARKMTAKLRAMGYDAYFYEPAAGGHGYGKDNEERAAFVALGYNFLREQIGWDG